MKKPAWIVMDIEGTTSSVSFVHDVLFPYAFKNLEKFIQNNKQDQMVAESLSEAARIVRATEGRDIGPDEIIPTLLRWIKEDKKHTPLKTIQGMIWKYGYENKEYQSHIYDDVLPCWKKWQKEQINLAIYSSGSIPAQKLLFKHTSEGNVCHCLSAYFDTTTGAKRDTNSYQKIAKTLETPSESILFLSDIVEELHAAKEAGFQCTHVIRPGTQDQGFSSKVKTFNDLIWTT